MVFALDLSNSVIKRLWCITITPDKRGSHINIVLLSQQKHMLRVLNRSASEALLMSTRSICFHGE